MARESVLIGLKSGEYGGRKSSRAPRSPIAARGGAGNLDRSISYPGREGWTAMKTTRERYTGVRRPAGRGNAVVTAVCQGRVAEPVAPASKSASCPPELIRIELPGGLRVSIDAHVDAAALARVL